MQKKNVRNVLQNIIAVADVQQIRINSMEILMMHMILVVKCKEKELNVQS